jgi:sec-independent protein translocase protein TatB
MLNVGPLELLVVLAVALIVVGPERLPELARSVGRALRQLRQVQDEVRDMVSAGVDDDVRRAASDFKKATGDIARSSGIEEVTRKRGRTAGPRKVSPGSRRSVAEPAGDARDRTPTPEPAPTPPAQPEERPAGMDAEGAGPPADRLVEDGAAPAEEATRTSEDPDERTPDR